MLDRTDLERVKAQAKVFLNYDMKPKKSDDSLRPVLHPVYDYGIIVRKESAGFKAYYILDNKEDLQKIREEYLQWIDECETVTAVFAIIKKSWRLTFIKAVEDFLSLEDFSEIFSYIWRDSESPNMDANVSIPELIRYFKIADKRILMEDENYEVFKNLPDEFVIYRGVGTESNPMGLSWTRNREKAIWFAKRFDFEKVKKGYVQRAVVKKEWVLAYFNDREEEEIVVNPRKLNITKKYLSELKI